MQAQSDSLVVELAAPDDFAGFRQAARVLLAVGAEPHAIHWCWQDPHARQRAAVDLFAADTQGSLAGKALTPDALDQLPLPPGQAVRLQKPQLSTLRSACCHNHAGRFALCYRWLFRVQQSPRLRGDALDADWREIERLAKAVGRDIHKMHAFVRFRPTHTDGGESIDIAWFEPDHYIVRAAANFFMRRFSNMRWAILTPQCSVHWDLQQLQFAEGSCAAAAPGPDAGEALWLTYYQSTFNPARLKEQAMQREMPRKYWKNLPEARLISEMVASATRRTGRMLDVPPHGGAKRASLAFNHLPV